MPRAASWNSKGEGGDYIEWNSEYMGGGGGSHGIGIPKVWGSFQRGNTGLQMEPQL